MWTVLRKVVLIPIVIILTLIEWCAGFLTGVAVFGINLLSSLLLIAAVASYVLGAYSGMELLKNVVILLGAVIVGNLLTLCVGVISAVKRITEELL